MNDKIKYLYEHTSQETAKVVEDYPWGFRLRTKIRYWVETKKAKNGGQRFGSQTVNPKTGLWCAPKYSTYSPIIVMCVAENDHVQYTSLSRYSNEKELLEFKEKHLEYLNEFQKQQLTELIAINNVMKHVKWEIKPSIHGSVSLLSRSPEDIEKRKLIAQEQEENKKNKEIELDKINRAIGYEISKITL